LLLVQKEVAERISAGPGTKQYGILAVQTQLWATAGIVFTVGPESFRPQPKVSSALLRLHLRETLEAAPRDPEFFRRVVRAAFARRRKTLANSFAAEAPGFSKPQILDALAQTGIDSRRRPETLTVAEFVKLSNVLAEIGAGLAPPVHRKD
jgi:16S rRNA (adenine1518-N6/adenine1519-N6)-dimethyltransferase